MKLISADLFLLHFMPISNLYFCFVLYTCCLCTHQRLGLSCPSTLLLLLLLQARPAPPHNLWRSLSTPPPPPSLTHTQTHITHPPPSRDGCCRPARLLLTISVSLNLRPPFSLTHTLAYTLPPPPPPPLGTAAAGPPGLQSISVSTLPPPHTHSLYTPPPPPPHTHKHIIPPARFTISIDLYLHPPPTPRP